MLARSLLPFALVAGGCISTTFHARTSAPLPPVADRAVIVEGGEAGQVTAQGQLVGTIAARGTADKEAGDLAARAAEVAAIHGGTHVVVTEEGEETHTYVQPATQTRTCTHDDDTTSCETTYTPETTSTTATPYSQLEVYRVAPAAWQDLPAELRPAAYDAAHHGPSSADGLTLALGGFSAPFVGPTHGTSGDVFPTAYSATASRLAGGWIGASYEHGSNVIGGDLRFGAASTSGTAMNVRDGTAPVAYTKGYGGVALAVRLGKRLAWRNFSLSAGSGVAGAVWVAGNTHVAPGAPYDAVFVEPATDTVTDLAVPVWSALLFKPTCSFGLEGLAEYDVRPFDFASSAPSFSLGVVWQPASACR